MRHRRSRARAVRVRVLAAVLSLTVLFVCAAVLAAALVTRVAGVGSSPGAVGSGPVAGSGRAAADAPSARDRGSPAGPGAGPHRDRPGGVTPREARWRGVLRALDRRRARAYSRGHVRLLRQVYVAGTPVLRRDAALLRRYRRRDLRVTGLRLRVRDLHVRDLRVRATGEPERVRLFVRDQVVAGVVRGRTGHRRLHRDAPDDLVVTLRRLPGRGWRIGAVRRARLSPARRR